MKRWVALTAVPLVGVVIFLAAERRQKEAEVAKMRADIAALSQSVDATQKDVASVGRGMERQLAGRLMAAPGTAAAGEQARGTAAPPSEEAPPRETSLEVRRKELAEVRDQLEAKFGQERVDPQWTGRAQATAETRLTAVIPEGSNVRSVECRASMCRIETVHEDVMHFQQFAQSAFLDPEKRLWNGGGFSTTLTDPVDGKLVIVSYLAKEGEPLPMPVLD